MLTEEEAKTKWCPLVRALVSIAENGATPARDLAISSANRGNNAELLGWCVASSCMAWRKVDQIGIGPNGEKRDRDLDGRTRWVDRGFCGAFGKPSGAE